MPDQRSGLVDFLDGLGMAEWADRFLAEDIDMSVLPLLEPPDLSELGLTLGQRRRLLSALKALAADTAPPTPGAAAGNRAGHIRLRRLSVLFCDMIGSTDLGERLSIDEMQAVLAHYYAIAGRIADRHDGHIATVQGDGVIMLFGYPRAVDGMAAHCLQAALALQSALAAEPAPVFARDPIPIRTRIGIATGKAAVGRPDDRVPGGAMHLVGPVVNRAARLQTLAADLAIVVDERTREQAKAHFAFSDPEPVRLKGLQQDVAVSRVLGPAPRRMSAPRGLRQLIGRERELAELGDIWNRVRTGQPQLVTVTGEAGIGKTDLVRTFLSQAVGTGGAVLQMDGAPVAEQNALWPVASYLDPAQAQAEGGYRARKARALADLLARTDAALAEAAAAHLGIAPADRGAGSPPDARRREMLDLLARWITDTPDGPAVVVLDNAHWADPTTRELMALCAASLGVNPAPVMMIALTRDEALAPWGDGGPAHRIAVDTLAAAAAEAILDRVTAGHPLPQSVRQNILRHAGGNPLMIETLGHSHEAWHAADLVGEVDVPVAIYELVSKRLDAITSGQDVIEALAVLNEPTDPDTLARVVGRPAAEVERTLQALQPTGLTDASGQAEHRRYRIRHQVYRDVIYEQITGQTREMLHRAAFAALRERDRAIDTARPDILALHAQAARDLAAASVHALDAAERLLRQSALVEASYFFRLAGTTLEAQPDDPETDRKRLRAATGLASVERSRFGIGTDASGELGRKVAELAGRLGDSQAELLALNGLYAHALVRADYRQAGDRAETLLAAAREAGNPTFEMIGTRAQGVVALHRGDLATALDRLQTALAQYDRSEHLALAHAHGYDHAEICAAFLAFAHWLRGDPVAARRISDFSVSHSRAIDHAHSLGQAMAFQVMLGALARDADALIFVGPEAVALGDRHDLRVMRTAGHFFPFAAELCARAAPPDPDELDELQARMEAFVRVNPFNYGPFTASLQADTALRAGRLDLARAALDRGDAIQARTGETWTAPELARLRALYLARSGDADAARRLRHDAHAQAMSDGSVMLGLRLACDSAEDRPGDSAAAARLRDALARVQSDDGGWDIARARALSAA